MATDRIDNTIAHYQRSVPFYTQAFDASHSRHLDAFLDRLVSGAHVLELGCGTGRDAARMVQRGCTIDATDGTPAMLAKAKERYGLDARLMRFDQLDADARYDAVWAHACLFHVPRNDLPDVLARIYRALKPDGLHYASYKCGDGEGIDDRDRWNTLLPTDWIEQRYRDAGFSICDTMVWHGKGADGVARAWTSLIVQRPL